MIATFYPIQIIYALVFALAAVICFAAINRARDRLADRDTRWGLSMLLATSGLWATFHVGRILVPQPTVKITFYVLGLVVGLSTVGAWLYFCSAYTGKSYHQHATYRWLAVGVYTAIVSVKLTSPLHGLYFSTSSVTVPFPHLAIQFEALHWIVTGLAYALSAVGFYMLFEQFQNSNYATTRLGLLVGVAGLPVVFDLFGYLIPGVAIDLSYEPIGVALFAVGVLYVADGSFLAVRRFGREQLLDELDEAIVLLDTRGDIRDVNDAARRLFPALSDSIGEQLAVVAPELETYLPVDSHRIVDFDDADPPRYYLLSSPELSVGQTTIGRGLVFNDVTQVERQRRAVRHQQAQLDDFAEAITHELRNTLNVAQGHVEIVEQHLDPDSATATRESLATLSKSNERMMRTVDDLATLVRIGQPVEEPTSTDVASVARNAWESTTTEDALLSVDVSEEIEADPIRLERLFEKLFEFARTNGATQIAVAQSDGELVVSDDGTPIGDTDTEDAFTYGQAVPDAESGMLLPVVRTLAEAHGWDATIDTGYPDGIRIRISYS